MIVVYNSDERYASAFAVSVLSLFESNQNAESITVYLIENGIEEKSKRRIQEIAEQYKRKIILIKMPDIEKMAQVNIALPSYNRITTCGRLFIASILPAEIDKVIYADCDTMFMDSLESIWNTDMADYMVGMAADAMGKADRNVLGIPPEGSYFNSGLMLVNVKRWRESGVERQFIDYLVQQEGYVPFPDQGTLNAVFDGKILTLPATCNVYSMPYAFSYEEILKTRCPDVYYTKEEVASAIEHPTMVHFTTNFILPLRPWVKGCNHPCVQQYLAYRDKTPWKDEPLWDDNRGKLKKYLYLLYATYWRWMPKPIGEWTTRMIYTRIQPSIHLMKRLQCRKQMIAVQKRAGGGKTQS